MRALIAILAAVLASPSAWAQTVDDLDEVFYRTVFTNEALVKDYFFSLLETDSQLVAYALSIQASDKCDAVKPSTVLREAINDEHAFKSPYGIKVYLVTQKMMMPPEGLPERTTAGLCKKLLEFIHTVERNQ